MRSVLNAPTTFRYRKTSTGYYQDGPFRLIRIGCAVKGGQWTWWEEGVILAIHSTETNQMRWELIIEQGDERKNCINFSWSQFVVAKPEELDSHGTMKRPILPTEVVEVAGAIRGTDGVGLSPLYQTIRSTLLHELGKVPASDLIYRLEQGDPSDGSGYLRSPGYLYSGLAKGILLPSTYTRTVAIGQTRIVLGLHKLSKPDTKTHSTAALMDMMVECIKSVHAVHNWPQKTTYIEIWSHAHASSMGMAFSPGNSAKTKDNAPVWEISLNHHLLRFYDLAAISRTVVHELTHHIREEKHPRPGNEPDKDKDFHDRLFKDMLAAVDPLARSAPGEGEFFKREMDPVAVSFHSPVKHVHPERGYLEVYRLKTGGIMMQWRPDRGPMGKKEPTTAKTLMDLLDMAPKRNRHNIRVSFKSRFGDPPISALPAKGFAFMPEFLAGLHKKYPGHRFDLAIEMLPEEHRKM